jgi:hypothetical protein
MILGLSGKMQSGKDTVALYLMKKYGFHRIAFADRLKELATNYFNWDGEKDDHGRKLLQDIGMKLREIRDDIWVDCVLRKVNDKKNIGKNYVVTDVRFANEFKLLILSGAKIFRIERKLDRDKECDKHPSETDLDNEQFSDIIYNDGTISELYISVDMILSKYNNELS